MQLKRSGFALIEVLVALAFIGLALPALLIRMQTILSSTVYYEEKTYAHWIADNKIESLKADQKLGKAISRVRKDSEIIEYGGREWQVELGVEEMPLPDILASEKFYRVTIDVALEENRERTLASISAFFNE